MSHEQRIIEYFLEHPTTRIHARALERTLRLPFPSISKYCNGLAKRKFLTTNSIGNIVQFAANRDDSSFIEEKKIHNYAKIIRSSLIKKLTQDAFATCIVLFGSYAKGDDVENSDIDVFVQTKVKIPPLVSVEQDLGKTIHVISADSLRRITNKELANNILSGITIYGQMEVIR